MISCRTLKYEMFMPLLVHTYPISFLGGSSPLNEASATPTCEQKQNERSGSKKSNIGGGLR